jgi:hypothetical protein
MRYIVGFIDKWISIFFIIIALFVLFLVDKCSNKKDKEVEKHRNGEIEWINGLNGRVILKGQVYKDRKSGIAISLNDVDDDDVTIYCTSPDGTNEEFYLDNGQTAKIAGNDDSEYQIMPIFLEKENYAVFSIDLVQSETKKSAVSKKFEETFKSKYGYPLKVGDSYDENELHLHINSIDVSKQVVYAECIYPKYNSKNAELEAGRYYGYNFNGKVYRFKITDIKTLESYEPSQEFRLVFEEELQDL